MTGNVRNRGLVPFDFGSRRRGYYAHLGRLVVITRGWTEFPSRCSVEKFAEALDRLVVPVPYAQFHVSVVLSRSQFRCDCSASTNSANEKRTNSAGEAAIVVLWTVYIRRQTLSWGRSPQLPRQITIVLWSFVCANKTDETQIIPDYL